MGPNVLPQFFLNPAFVSLGALLAIVATPIIIHFINRLRYKRVRFAAMEFLFNSEKQNRQRVMLEQLLLLLLRILIVLFLLALIARMIFSSDQVAQFVGKKAIHVVLLDDSASMRQKWGETSAFEEGIKTIKTMVAEGAKRPDTKKITLVLLSNPNKPIISSEVVNNQLVKTLETKLNNLHCSHRTLDLAEGLKTVQNIFENEKGSSKTLHVISDYRQEDWGKRSAIADAVADIDKADVKVNFIRSLPDEESETGNLAITSLTGNVQAAAPGIAVTFQVQVTNHTQVTVKNVRLAVFKDGEKIPMTVRINAIEPGKSVSEGFEVTYQKQGNHTLKLSLEPDALESDNHRFMTLNIKPRNQILIIDGIAKGSDDPLYLADALEPRPSIGYTGYYPVIKQPDYLSKQPLSNFQSIYMVNVGQINREAIKALNKFVQLGGGLVWFMGDKVDSAYYNEHLYKASGKGLFPVPLRGKSKSVIENKETKSGADLAPGNHPLFKLFIEIPVLAKMIDVSAYIPVLDQWERDDNVRKDGVATIAHFRNNAPFFFEHHIGKGKIITCLTSGGVLWNNWAKTPSYLPFIQITQKHIGKNSSALSSRISGSTIELDLDPAQYTEKIEITSPGDRTRQSNRVDAKVVKRKKPPKKMEKKNKETEKEKEKKKESKPAEEETRLVFNFGDQNTDHPGIYIVKLSKTVSDDAFEERWLAFNSPEPESHLPIATDSDIKKRIGDKIEIEIQKYGSTAWVKGQDAGHEVKMILLILIVLLFLGEQALAYRLSFHAAGSSKKQKSRLAGPARATVS